MYKTGIDGMIDWNEKQLLEAKKPERRNQNFMGKGSRPDLFPIDREIKDAQDNDEFIYRYKTSKLPSDFPDRKKIEKLRKKMKSKQHLGGIGKRKPLVSVDKDRKR